MVLIFQIFVILNYTHIVVSCPSVALYEDVVVRTQLTVVRMSGYCLNKETYTVQMFYKFLCSG